jgi:heme/copper-type cytochrome/quinol oxidase subunit 2
MTLIVIGTYYLYVGAAVAAAMILFGIGRLDENAQGAWIFRPLLIPGFMLIWPLVIWRSIVLWRGEEKLDRHRMPRKGQERMSIVLFCAIPLIIVIALAVRQDPETLAKPILIEATQ